MVSTEAGVGVPVPSATRPAPVARASSGPRSDTLRFAPGSGSAGGLNGFAITAATWNGGGTTNNWNEQANWVGFNPPTPDPSTVIRFAGSTRTMPNNDYPAFSLFSQILFEAGAAPFTLNGNAVKLNFKIENNSANTQTYNMAGLSLAPSTSGGFVELDPTAGDLIVDTPGSSIFLDNNAVLLVFGTHVLRVNAVIANGGGSTGAFSLMGAATVIFNNANTYTGDTQINAGDLRFTPAGSANSSIIRLGSAGNNTPEATLSLGASSAETGVNLASTLVVRPGTGTQGTRVLRSLNTTGSNQYSGGIFLDTGLTLRAATGGTMLLQGGSVDVKAQTLTIDDLSGNVNTQGTIRINEPLISSFGAGGSLVKSGAGTLILQGTNNSYTGTVATTLNANGTQISGGILGIYGDGSLGLVPAGAYNNVQFTGSGTLQDTANNVTLHANRSVSIANGATATFDSNGNIFTINGVINGPGGNVAKTGGGSVVLAGANTFTGSTTVNAGVLNLAATNALANSSGITVNSGGTLLLSNAATNNRIGDAVPLSLNANGSATVAFDTGGLSEHGANE